MAIYTQTFTLATAAECTAVKMFGSDLHRNGRGDAGAIVSQYVQHLGPGTGGQFIIRYYLGTTASKTARYLGSVTIPAVADSWHTVTSKEAVIAADPRIRFSTMQSDFAAGWSDGSTTVGGTRPKAGMGVYWTAQSVGGTSGTDAITAIVDIGRYGN